MSDVARGQINFLDGATESSLYRNSKVLIRRDLDGSDSGVVGVVTDSKEIEVHDARGAGKTCLANGFELLDAPLTGDLDFFNHASVVQSYYPDCEALVEQSTGGRAFAFDHNIRSATGKAEQQQIVGGQTVQGPAKMVHGDYTLTSAPQRLRDLTLPPKANDTYRTNLPEGEVLISPSLAEQALSGDGRFAIINVWRNIDELPVARNPMAMCDAATVSPEDLVVFEIHYSDRIGENYFSKYSEQQRFYYFPDMTRDEPMLLKQWDSYGALAKSAGRLGDDSETEEACTFSFHTAFEPPDTQNDAPDRWSIEVRCMVIY